MLKSTPLEQRKMARLYAQFTIAKSTSMKKFFTGLTPIRKSDSASPRTAFERMYSRLISNASALLGSSWFWT
jgi:hypothetical protein